MAVEATPGCKTCVEFIHALCVLSTDWISFPAVITCCTAGKKIFLMKRRGHSWEMGGDMRIILKGILPFKF